MTILSIRILLVLMALLVIPALFLHIRYFRKRQNRRKWQILLWAIVALLCVSSITFVLTGFRSGSPEWLWRLFFPLLVGIFSAEIAACLGGAIGCVIKKYTRKACSTSCEETIGSRIATYIGLAASAICIIIATMAYFIGNKRIEVKEYSFYSKDLPPAFDGMRIVHFSDLHLGTYGTDTTRVSQLLSKVMEQKGDIIVFTGDLVNFESKEALPFVKQLNRLNAPFGVYSILGNHDYAVYRMFDTKEEQVADIRQLMEIEKQAGWKLLRNENALIHKDGQAIALVGMENEGKPPFPHMADIPKAMKGLPDTIDGNPLFKIVLTHDPTHWRSAILKDTDAQLTLAGHTHGLQFKIGGWSPASLIYKEWGGQYYEGNRSIVVSVGLGLGTVPFRFGAWSEVCVITLHTGDSQINLKK